MALLPSARVAVRLALANYLRTNLAAPWPNLVIAENWPTPQRAFPPQALTVLAPLGGLVTQYHEPVIWRTSDGNIMYSYGRHEIPLELDVWAQHESIRDDLASSLFPLLNQNVGVTLGTATNANLANAPGLVLTLPTYSNITAEYVFDPIPAAIETPEGATVSDWRYVWRGSATVYQIQNEPQPLMKSVTVKMGINGAAATDVYPYTYQGAVMADAPALYWRLGDPAGSTSAADSSTNGRTGTLTSPGSITFGTTGLLAVGTFTDDVNNAAAASTSGPSVRSSANLGIGGGGVSTFSVEWWIKPSGLTANGNDIGQVFNVFYCRQNADGSITVGTNLANAITSAAGTYAVGKTVHCVFTYDGSAGRLYLNGQLTNGPTTMPVPASALNAFGFGVTGPWQSTVQEIAVYPTALSATRVLNHYFLGFVGP